jgi:ethanolamine utilization microcompartment shell protein EutS
MRRLPKFLGRLPRRFQWTLHNLLAHPASELLWQFGLSETSDRVHDLTVPEKMG